MKPKQDPLDAITPRVFYHSFWAGKNHYNVVLYCDQFKEIGASRVS